MTQELRTHDLASQGKDDAARSWSDSERRNTKDRRDQPTTFFAALFGRGQRQRGRRHGEGDAIYVDVYGRREIGLVALVLFLNILDALFTLNYLGKGGYEANPVARGLLDLGDDWFLFAKSFAVGLCLLFLLVHKTFPYVTQALYILTGFYGALFGYHLFLQIRFQLTH
ncbi:MAG: DUF5658 family protein [Planctomycetota bacterium]